MALTVVEMLLGKTKFPFHYKAFLMGKMINITMLSQNIIWMYSTLGMPIKKRHHTDKCTPAMTILRMALYTFNEYRNIMV
jgi:hypothetical protein